MLITSMNDIPGQRIEKVFGEVFGLTVRSRNLGSQLGAAFKSLAGGELKGARRTGPTTRPSMPSPATPGPAGGPRTASGPAGPLTPCSEQRR